MKRLKMFSVLLVMMISAGLMSCSDDDGLDVNLIYGTWQLVNESGYYYEDGERYDFNDDVSGGPIFVFNEDGTATIGGEAVNWSLSGKRLTISYTDETIEARVVTLNESTMVFEYSDSDEDGEYFEKLTFTKVS